jgi:hypothetical protein
MRHAAHLTHTYHSFLTSTLADLTVEDLAQLDSSELALMDPAPLKFAVKVPVGGIGGRRMNVHLPDG